MGGLAEQQKERFSRAWIVAAAAGADYTYDVLMDDLHGVDMTVRDQRWVLDFQLKATSHPTIKGNHLIHDLDVRTYDLLRDPERTGYGVLALIVVHDDPQQWLDMDGAGTRLARSAYYLPMAGLPAKENTATVRLRIPLSNLLTIAAMKSLMNLAAARWAS
jgi:hypothetical protein